MSKSEQAKTRHRKVQQAQSGTARAALLGLSDGLVTNVSLILGVAAAGTSSDFVRLAGFASLIAGAISMAVGEYISMRGQIELLESVLEDEKAELESDPAAAKAILRDTLIADGLTRDTATKASEELSGQPDKALSTYARGKFGINPDELGSAWGSAASSFVMFSIGALIPLLPWLGTQTNMATYWSVALSATAALGIGAYLGLTTNGSWIKAALRQLLILVLAAGATYLVGNLFHVSVVG